MKKVKRVRKPRPFKGKTSSAVYEERGVTLFKNIYGLHNGCDFYVFKDIHGLARWLTRVSDYRKQQGWKR